MTCRICSIEKDDVEFEIANVIDGKQYRRKTCRRCKGKRQTFRRKEIRDTIRNIKGGMGCEVCGMSDWRCLDFHHVDPEDKKMAVANMYRLGYGLDAILNEIKKCNVLCANCHRIEHYTD